MSERGQRLQRPKPATRTPQGLEDARRLLGVELRNAIASGFPAGFSLLVVDADGPLLELHGGHSCLVGERIATTDATVYDLASLTKVTATVPLALWLAQRRAWSLDDPAARWLDELDGSAITIRQLLTHTSGLAAHREYFWLAGGGPAIRAAVLAEAGEAVGPAPVNYSDLGYMLLGWAVESCSGMPLDRLFAEVIATGIGMARTGFSPAPGERRGIAATELDGDQRLVPGLVWGEVHDGNAWALGGVAGHAGLFAPAYDVGRFASALLAADRHPVLSRASLDEMAREHAGAPPDVRALGWRLDARDWGPWPPATYWHTGFTGTSLLVAPERGIAVVLLMGGVHPIRNPEKQTAVRRTVHQIISEAVR